jgi:coproporphyrinogen III oxidase
VVGPIVSTRDLWIQLIQLGAWHFYLQSLEVVPGLSLMLTVFSLPRWEYMHEPPKGTLEADMLEVLQNPKEWV